MGRFSPPLFGVPFYREKLLLLFIELYAISKVYIFKREHDHAGGGCWSRTDYHDFADGAPRIIRNVDSGTLAALGEHVRLVSRTSSRPMLPRAAKGPTSTFSRVIPNRGNG